MNRPNETTPEGVRLIAAGMEAARHDRLVWTDDDFHHPPDWLATLNADYEEYGASIGGAVLRRARFPVGTT